MTRPAGSRTPLLGAVADDLTGACDLADALVQAGLATVLVVGVPDAPLPACDAVVVALKTRTVPADDAVAQSSSAAAWLADQGVERLFFKYCSTFDSTPEGNIGPVTDALLSQTRWREATAGQLVVHGPAYPVNERTLYRGHLFVGDVLLSDSGMAKHPLTPMTDPNLVRVLGRQTASPVGLLHLAQVRVGVDAVRARLDELAAGGVRHVLADAAVDADVATTAQAIAGHRLAAGGAAFGAAWGAAQDPARRAARLPRLTAPDGRAAVLVGSASTTTSAQVEAFGALWPVLRLEPGLLGVNGIETVLSWAHEHLDDGPVLVAADTSEEGIRATRDRFGDTAAERVEATLAGVAVGLLRLGVRRLVVAGGETSGAVATALDLTQVQVGPQISPGVPWTVCAEPELAVAFKSGNFGATTFFLDALAGLDSDAWDHR